MNYTDEQLLAFLAGELPEEESKAIENELQHNSEMKVQVTLLEELNRVVDKSINYEPSHQLFRHVKSLIEEEQTGQTKHQRSNWMKVAASVSVILVTFWLGFAILGEDDQGAEIEALQYQIEDLKQSLVMGSLTSYTASERLQALYQLEDEPVRTINEKLLQTLIKTLNTDDSPNVRFAAMQALKKYSHEEKVLLAMIDALEQQDDAFIQIALIQVLVDADAKAAISPLKKVLKDQNTPDEVKQQAQVAIDILI